MKRRIGEYGRVEFRNIVNQFVHPSQNVYHPNQLKGREAKLIDLRDAFETPGASAFIWGSRGVGKTSIGHTSCEVHNDIVELAAAVACDSQTSVNTLMADMVRKIVDDGKVNLSNKDIQTKFSIFGIEVAGKSIRNTSIAVESVNHSADLIATITKPISASGKTPVILIDEFDRLSDEHTKRHFTDLLKQLSASGTSAKFVFCGVATSLSDLLGQHASAERYIQQIELRPLSQDALWEIVHDVEAEFDIQFSRGQRIRIAQISDGYAHFTHLILKNILLEAHSMTWMGRTVTDEIYRKGIDRSLEQSASRLKEAYEAATQKGSDSYIEALWAAAHGPLFRKQYKNIANDYAAIMDGREDRPRLDDQQLRNSLNRLAHPSHGGILTRFKVGWYEFADPMVRSYVRLRAEAEGVALGQHHFRD